MKKQLLAAVLLFFFALQANAQLTNDNLYGAWFKEDVMTDTDSKTTVINRYLFMSNGTGRYTKVVKQAFNNKRINPSFTVWIGYSWSVVNGSLNIIFDKESHKTIEANPAEEKWRTGAEFWAGLLERKHYKTDLAGQTIILTVKKPTVNDLLLDGGLYKKQ